MAHRRRLTGRDEKISRIMLFGEPSGGRSLAEFKINAISDET